MSDTKPAPPSPLQWFRRLAVAKMPPSKRAVQQAHGQHRVVGF